MFPAGLPGIALLLLRVGVSATVLATGWNSQVPVLVLLVLLLHCLFLCLGIFTPLLAAIGCAFELVSGVFMNHQSIVALFSSRACSHYSQRFDDECKAEKRQENDVQFFKT